MPLRITIEDDGAPRAVKNVAELMEALRSASAEAKARRILGAILIEAENGNVMTMVVGGEETVLGFDAKHLNLPYYASRGEPSCDEPRLTCYLKFRHHSEFARKYVISFKDGLCAAEEFLATGRLPTCMRWEEV